MQFVCTPVSVLVVRGFLFGKCCCDSCGSCFGVLCVVGCWMCGGCSWLVGWGDQGVGFLIGFCLFVRSSVLVLVFVESGVFVAFALGFGLVSWPCGDSAVFEESFHMQLCLMEHLFAHVPHSWDCGVFVVVAVLQI